MSKTVALSHLLTDSAEGSVAANLRAEVARATAWLQQQPPGPAAIYLADAHLFAVWLLACWQDDRCAILPGDATQTTAQQLHERGVLLLGDFAGATLRDGPQDTTEAELHVVPDAQLAVEVYTSGSTGVPVCIGKTLRQLDAEVHVLEAALGSRLSLDLLLRTTVSHQHLYGLLFCILWPLARQQQDFPRPVTYPEELLAIDRNFSLISSPAFLKRLPHELPWPVPSHCRQVFSSGGTLPADAAINAGNCLATVTEIFGSSETGGIARRDAPTKEWTIQPGVEVRLEENGCLAVRSPFLPDDDWFVTADQARMTDKGFVLEGRSDRIVKIEEKRISLTALETSLCSHDWISEARIVPLEGSRTVLAAAVVLTPAGREKLEKDGKFSLSQTLRAVLAREFERVALPRRWRFVSQIPVNTMGKTTDHALSNLFAEKPRLPHILGRRSTETGIVMQLELQQELASFDGHFAGLPILPGVAQLDWAMHYASTLMKTPLDFLGMEAVKFQKIIQPGMQIELVLDYLPAKGMLQFRYESAAGVHASGRIRLGKKTA